MGIKVEMHKQICKDLNKLYEAKNSDYGNSAAQSYEEFGDTSWAIRLGDKLNRYKNLIKNVNNAKDSNQQKVKDESIEDTLLDLANYAIMAVVERRLGKKPLKFDRDYLHPITTGIIADNVIVSDLADTIQAGNLVVDLKAIDSMKLHVDGKEVATIQGCK